MNDVGIFIDEGLRFNLKLENGDLKGDAGLETAVTISLFSDRRIRPDELLPGETDKRGWFGDTLSEIEGDQIGSRLWLLARAKRTLETLRLAEDYAREALEWLVSDGIARDVQVEAEFQGEVEEGRWALKVVIIKPSGEESRFTALWDNQKLIRG